MQVQPFIAQLAHAETAERARGIIASCVHCGMCNATCPTYQLLGNELDGPRGRIYLIKNMLESGESGATTQLHLDRCLTCQACETTCPSGVQYGSLVEIGRELAEEHNPYSRRRRALRWLLLQILPQPKRVRPFIRMGQYTRLLWPAFIKNSIPPLQRPRPTTDEPTDQPAEAVTKATDTVLLHSGCVQSVATPNTNAAASAILSKLDVASTCTEANCCGAMHWHLNQKQQGLELIKSNVDSWEPQLRAGASHILATASGCGAFIQSYATILEHDPDYADKARYLSERCLDISVYLQQEDRYKQLQPATSSVKVSLHTPCTLQHAQKQPSILSSMLRELGFKLTTTSNPHLCCGSAGTYSIFQRKLAQQLRARKLQDLNHKQSSHIVTANIGCQLHLANSQTPVTHWLELVAEHCVAAKENTTAHQQ